VLRARYRTLDHHLPRTWSWQREGQQEMGGGGRSKEPFRGVRAIWVLRNLTEGEIPHDGEGFGLQTAGRSVEAREMANLGREEGWLAANSCLLGTRSISGLQSIPVAEVRDGGDGGAHHPCRDLTCQRSPQPAAHLWHPPFGERRGDRGRTQSVGG
jgi:hypothetical protein